MVTVTGRTERSHNTVALVDWLQSLVEQKEVTSTVVLVDWLQSLIEQKVVTSTVVLVEQKEVTSSSSTAVLVLMVTVAVMKKIKNKN